MLETRNKCDNLYKELDRRQIRNETLMKELQNLRQQLKETIVSYSYFIIFIIIIILLIIIVIRLN